MTHEAPRPSPAPDLPQLLSRFDRLLDDLDALIEEARARPSTEDRLTELYSAITAASDLLAETITDADTTLRSMQGMQQQLQADIQELKRGMRAVLATTQHSAQAVQTIAALFTPQQSS